MTFAVSRAKGQRDDKIVTLAEQFPDESLALTQAVMAGDEAAASDFFNRYCDRLFRYLLVVCRGNEDAAREALSQAMIKAARHMKPMRSDEDIWRWLTQLAWTSFVDDCRKRQRRIVMLSDDGMLEAPTPESNTDWTTALNECLTELPKDERDIVERFYFENASQAELAEDKNSTRKSIESRLARIRQKLRAAILKKLA